jgi:hypothetical protein
MEKIVLRIILVYFLVVPAFSQGLGDEIFDPKINSNKSNSANSNIAKNNISSENPSPIDSTKIIRPLYGYGEGEVTHKDSFSFAQNLASEINALLDKNTEIDSILVKGFADGLHNDGKIYDIKSFPLRCQNGVEGLIDDNELAYLRGCIIWDSFSRAMGEESFALISWKRDAYDEPDGGKKGDFYRKTIVEIILKESKNQNERANYNERANE